MKIAVPTKKYWTIPGGDLNADISRIDKEIALNHTNGAKALVLYPDLTRLDKLANRLFTFLIKSDQR